MTPRAHAPARRRHEVPGLERPQERLQDRPPQGATSLVGECVSARHPTLAGRVRVRWAPAQGESRESWLATLRGSVVREGDRVLLQLADNWSEPIVIGVVDGFARRPEPDRVPGATLRLERDETVTLTTAEGRALVEIHQDEDGPVVRLADEDVHLELPGALRIDARQILLCAKRGGIEIAAEDDLHLRGEVIHLNPPREGGS